MPSEPEFTVKFALVADATAKGAKTIAAKFSFVNNNNKEVVEMAPTDVMVGDEAVSNTSEPASTQPTNVPVAPTTATTATAPTSFENPNEPNSNIICSRAITAGALANEYNVEVKIKKGVIKGFAKYQENVPAGFTVKGGKTNGSSFSVSDGKLKFVWVSLPVDEELVVSYVLEKGASSPASSNLDNGEFSYLENDQSKKVKMKVEPIEGSVSSPIANNEVATPANNTNTTAVVTETVATNQVATSEPTKTEVVNTNEPTKVQPKETIAKKRVM